jgi:hypothetical protein
LQRYAAHPVLLVHAGDHQALAGPFGAALQSRLGLSVVRCPSHFLSSLLVLSSIQLLASGIQFVKHHPFKLVHGQVEGGQVRFGSALDEFQGQFFHLVAA